MALPAKMKILLPAAALLALAACRLPEQRQEFYSDGTLKERFWVYQGGGREVMHGFYVSYYPNGQREVEILYRDGSEVTKTYYTERGTVMGTVTVASLPEP
jgi:antitoxin component YwqK of YwqJK toxin-antitoxin module